MPRNTFPILPGVRLFVAVLTFLSAAVLARQDAFADAVTVSVADHDHVLRIVGRNASDLFGVSLEVVHDASGPRNLILIGSSFASDPTGLAQTGRVDIFDGAQLTGPGLIQMVSPTVSPLISLYGQFSGDRFGSRTQTGDFNGDGTLDLAVSAPYFGVTRGRVYLFLSRETVPGAARSIWDVTSEIRAASADVVFEGENPSTGQTLTAGDFDGDGVDDLAIGTPSTQVGLGKVYVVRGKKVWSATEPIHLKTPTVVKSSSTAVFIRTYRGRREENRLGESLAVGDLNGDSTPDLIIGGDNEDLVTHNKRTTTFLKVGRVYMILGDRVFQNHSATGEIVLTTRTADLVLSGKEEFDLFGDNLLVARWNPEDSIDDLWVSAPGAEPTPSPDPQVNDDRGVVALYPGSTSSFCFPEDATTALLCFSGNWRAPGYRAPDLLSLLEGNLSFGDGLPGSATNEFHYPARASNALVGIQKGAQFGGAMAVGDVLPQADLDELVIGSSFLTTGMVSVVTHADIAWATPGTPRELDKNPESLRILGELMTDRFGFRVGSADLFADEGDEIIVTAPLGGGLSGAAEGVVYIFNANTLLNASANRASTSKDRHLGGHSPLNGGP